MIKLSDIKECGLLLDEKQSKWFFKRGNYYFIVRSDTKTSYFYLDNLDMANYWTNEIRFAKEFYDWYQKIKLLRYENEEQENFNSYYDFIIDFIIEVNIPECDLDQYSHKTFDVDVATFSLSIAKSFCENKIQDMNSYNDQQDSTKTEQTPASTSDGLNTSNRTPEDIQNQ